MQKNQHDMIVQSETDTLQPDWRRAFSLREMGVYYALILLVVILSIATSYLGRQNYLSLANFSAVLYQASLVGMMGVAMTVVLITGNFDLSVASVAALSGAVMIGLADSIGFWPAFAAGMAVAVAAGLLNGLIVLKLGINAFIVTLGTLTALRGIMLIYTDGRSLAVNDQTVLDWMTAFEATKYQLGLAIAVLGVALAAWGAAIWVRQSKSPGAVGLIIGGAVLFALTWVNGFVISLPAPVIYMAAFALCVWSVLSFTIFGRRIYAVGGNPEAALLSGVNVFGYKLMAFVLSSATAGFAGILFGSRLKSINPSALSGAELTVIAAAILGGTSLFGGSGSVIKTLAGGLLLYSLTNGFNILNLGANYQPLIEGIVVVTAAAIYTIGGKKFG